MRIHVVRQGEHLASIAWRARVSAEAIWDHPANAALRRLRRDPNVLAPGDVLTLPDPVSRRLTVTPGDHHRFVTQVPRVTLDVSVGDEHGRWSGEAFRVEGAGAVITGTTDGQGVAHVEVPVDVPSVQLVVPGRHRRLRLDVGHLDPIDEEGGARARLANLGHLRATPPGVPDGLREGVEEFQRAEGLRPTGELDAETLETLSRRHGS